MFPSPFTATSGNVHLVVRGSIATPQKSQRGGGQCVRRGDPGCTTIDICTSCRALREGVRGTSCRCLASLAAPLSIIPSSTQSSTGRLFVSRWRA